MPTATGTQSGGIGADIYGSVGYWENESGEIVDIFHGLYHECITQILDDHVQVSVPNTSTAVPILDEPLHGQPCP